MDHFYGTIHGWFDFDNIYRAMVELAPQDRPNLFVELGSWVGKSAAYMSVEIANSGKDIRFDCVDSWEGTGAPGEYDHVDHMIQTGLHETFQMNMRPALGMYNTQRGLTTDVAQYYNEESIDFLFFDAGHTYEAISADLIAWLPKVRTGGWIAGHDFFDAPDGVGRAVRESVKGYRTSRASWYARTGDLTPAPLERLLNLG